MGDTEEKKFDAEKFNKEFDAQKNIDKERIKKLEDERLHSLNMMEPKKKLYQMTIFEIIVGIKNAWFDLLDDILEQRWGLELLTKNDRLFYIGITIFIISIIMYLYTIIIDDNNVDQPNKEYHYIYYTKSKDSVDKDIHNGFEKSPSKLLLSNEELH